MEEKHSILVAYDDVSIQHITDTFYIIVGDAGPIQLTETQMRSFIKAYLALQEAM